MREVLPELLEWWRAGETVGVATVVDRATGAQEAIETEGVPYRALLGLADLGLG